MTGTPNVLFRVDASPQIGIGHLQRCVSLAIALQKLGARCLLLTNQDQVVRQRAAAPGLDVEALNGVEPGGVEDLKHALAVATRRRSDVIVVDSYRASVDYLENLRAAGLLVVAIDDLAQFPFPCQIVVNGAARARALPYRSSSGDTRFLLGPEYVLLRPEFRDIPPRAPKEIVQNILIVLGGADPRNLMPELLARLDELTYDFTVTAVVGPFFENRDEVAALAKRCGRMVWLMDAPDSVRDLMLAADLAISAGGQTLYELAATGTPTVALQVADNQSFNLQALAAEGVIRVAGAVDEMGLFDVVLREVQALMVESGTRAQMAKAGQQLVDGRGANRLAQIIVDLCSN